MFKNNKNKENIPLLISYRKPEQAGNDDDTGLCRINRQGDREGGGGTTLLGKYSAQVQRVRAYTRVCVRRMYRFRASFVSAPLTDYS